MTISDEGKRKSTNPNAKIGDEEFVRLKYPLANACPDWLNGFEFAIYISLPSYTHKPFTDWHPTKLEAWADAASRLRAEEGIGEATIDRSSSGYSIPGGSHHTASFWQGFAMALGSVNRYFDNPTIVKSVMDGYGVTMKLLKDAAVEDYDLKEIRKCMR